MELLASPILDRYGRQVARPVPPQWFADAVETWAREWGRTATTRWEDAVGCFVTRFSRKSDDPVRGRVQQGRFVDDGEPYYWWDWSNDPVRRNPFGKMIPGYKAVDVEQLGASGVRARLDAANMWGRGEYSSLDDLADRVTAANEKRTNSKRAQLKEGLRDPLRATIRRARGDAQVGASGKPDGR